MAAVIKSKTVENRLDLLARGAVFDVCMASCNGNSAGRSGRVRDPADPRNRWLYPTHVPGKGPVHILKVLQTNMCTNSCSYCGLSACRDDVTRTGFTPDELADAFMKLVRARLAQGLFLSSGVGSNVESAMERMVRTAEILRFRYRYEGYIHLKILPGISDSLIERSASLADRLSINLEAPGPARLASIAPEKHFAEDLIAPMKKIGSLLGTGVRAKSQTTQFVVGASGENDQEILTTVDSVYGDLSVFRSYFSAYQPVGKRDARIAPGSEPLLREHRLYQSDFLLRGYGFRLPDIVFDETGNLPLRVDPKTAFALLHPERYPVDVNTASVEDLLRVPGIGPLSAQKILECRSTRPFRTLEELKSTGAWIHNASGYVLFSGKMDRGIGTGWRQNDLFGDGIPGGWHTIGEKVSGSTATVDEGPAQEPPVRKKYPGQEGKPIYYQGRKPSRPAVICR